MKLKRCIILANGRAPKKSVIQYFNSVGFTQLICADGGSNSAFKMKLIPNVIIGDLDSSNEKVLEFYRKKSVEIIQYNRQNDTDVEKCLKFAVSKKYNEVILCGGTGDRLDHTFCNIGVILKYSDKINIFMYHENSIMYAIAGKYEFTTYPSETISIYGFDNKTTFSSRGLKYQLKNSKLKFGEKESTSNVATGKSVSLNVRGGRGLIVREYRLLKKYDLLFSN
jgi:thiamine pyrophosphokinase